MELENLKFIRYTIVNAGYSRVGEKGENGKEIRFVQSYYGKILSLHMEINRYMTIYKSRNEEKV